MSIRQWLLRRLLPPRPEQLSAPTDEEAADLIDRTLAWQGLGRQAAPISCDEALALLTAYREVRERDDHPMIVAKIVDGPVTPEAGRNIADAIARMKRGDAIIHGPELELSILGRDPGVHWIPARLPWPVWAWAFVPLLSLIPVALGIDPATDLDRSGAFVVAMALGFACSLMCAVNAWFGFAGAHVRQDNRPPMPVAKDGEPLFPGHRGGNMVPPVNPVLRLRLTRGDTVIADHVIADGVLKCERRVDCAIYTVPVDDGTRHAYECALHWGGPIATDPQTQTLSTSAPFFKFPETGPLVFPGEHPRNAREPEAAMLPPGYVATGDRLRDVPVVGAHSMASQWCMAYVDATSRFTLTKQEGQCAVAQLRATSKSPKLWDLVMVRYKPACMGCGHKDCACALDDSEWSVDITVNGVPMLAGCIVDRPSWTASVEFAMYAEGKRTVLGSMPW